MDAVYSKPSNAVTSSPLASSALPQKGREQGSCAHARTDRHKCKCAGSCREMHAGPYVRTHRPGMCVGHMHACMHTAACLVTWLRAEAATANVYEHFHNFLDASATRLPPLQGRLTIGICRTHNQRTCWQVQLLYPGTLKTRPDTAAAGPGAPPGDAGKRKQAHGRLACCPCTCPHRSYRLAAFLPQAAATWQSHPRIPQVN